jgi:class 3 adenylate cyclase
MQEKYEELVKRIARLVKQNKELTDQNERVQAQNELLLEENEKYKRRLAELKVSATPQISNTTDTNTTLRFKMTTVLYANIHGFSKIADNNNSRSLMDQLDSLMITFNHIISKYKIEQIKTIGDTIMVAGGIPVKNITNPVEVVMAALEMLKALNEIQQNEVDKVWELKMGIHTGPVTATTTGSKKISYELKGETVNIATRMESSAVTNKIIISINTYEMIKEFFNCEYFGKMPVKYQGDLEMFVVKGIKPEMAKDEAGLIPNHLFSTLYGLIQFTDIQELVLDKLEKELPSYLYYHNVKHTVDVVTEVELIGWGEGVTDEEILILKTAGLFHDAGHTISYDNHEYYGCVLAREYLPRYNYTPEQIELICEIIMATKLPPQPQTLLQRIICDADLDYLGRSDFIPVSNTLYRELKEQNKIGTLNDWNKLQLKFISGHQYFTTTAQSLREVNKQKQIERIEQLIEPD